MNRLSARESGPVTRLNSAVRRLFRKWRSEPTQRVLLVHAICYTLFFAVGSLGHYVEKTRGVMLLITPGFLLLFGVYATTRLLFGSFRLLMWVAVTYLITFAIEAVGTATGLIFGSYQYGATLGAAAFDVPLIIGFNWVVVILGGSVVAGSALRGKSRTRAAIVGAPLVGLAALLFDFALEPVAMFFDYWSWEAGRVPARNYLAWFAIASIASIPVLMWDGHGELSHTSRSVVVTYVCAQFLFMLSLLPIALS